jgi:hypothetical protein
LAESKDHLENRVDSSQHLVARRVPGDLEKGSQLEAIVNHGAEAKSCKEVKNKTENLLKLVSILLTTKKAAGLKLLGNTRLQY